MSLLLGPAHRDGPHCWELSCKERRAAVGGVFQQCSFKHTAVQEAFGSGQSPVPMPISLLNMADGYKVVVGAWSSRKMLILIAFLPVREPDSNAACVGLHPTEGSSSTLFGKKNQHSLMQSNVFFPLLLCH